MPSLTSIYQRKKACLSKRKIKMRILLLSSFLPYPLYTGGHIRLFNLIKGLSKKHQIFLVCEKRNYQTRDDVEEVEKICEKVITFEREKQWSLWNILKTGFSKKPFLITGHTNAKMQEEISNLLKQESFDLIHVETFYVMQNLLSVDIPIVLAEHNIEYLVYKRFADKSPLLLKLILYIDVLKIKYWEEAVWTKATKLIAVSRIEKKIMEGKRKDVSVVSNGVDIDKFKVRSEKLEVGSSEKRILFIGDFKWLENRDAARFILEKIWPALKSKINSALQNQRPKISLWVVGKHIPEDLKRLGDDSVIFDENAPSNTSLIYQKADLLLAPIRVGGGTSFKILEAMSCGLPVITSSLGNEGIGAKDNFEILIANNTSEFVRKAKDVLENRGLYASVAQNARKLIEQKFDWKMIVQELEAVYESAIRA